MAPEKVLDTSSNRGLMIMEAVVGMAVLAIIMGGILVALRTQTMAATRTLKRARGRALLDGELEVLRGRTSEIEPCEDVQFEPVLGRPKGLGDVVFHKTVQTEEDGRLARVKLWATKKRRGRPDKWMSVEGVLFLAGGRNGESASK